MFNMIYRGCMIPSRLHIELPPRRLRLFAWKQLIYLCIIVCIAQELLADVSRAPFCLQRPMRAFSGYLSAWPSQLSDAHQWS